MAEKKWRPLLFIIAGVLLCDFLSKAYVHSHLPLLYLSSQAFPYDGIAVFRDWHGIDFCITHVMNKGAAWGMFASLHHYLFYFRLVAVGGLLVYLFFVKASPARKWALAFIAGGAMGNVCDYFLYGHVIDMFYFVFWGYSYPVFNVADSAIFCGIFSLVLQNLFSKISWKKNSPNLKEASR